MPSIFTRIIQGEIPAYKVAENDDFIAILDVFPLVEGHVLVIPKKETDNIFDLEPENLQELIGFSQNIAKAIEESYDCKKVGMAVIGLEVPHAHIHLLPINEAGDINFTKPKLQLTSAQLTEIQDKLKLALKN
jgi:histidine triad (HIT) family protein